MYHKDVLYQAIRERCKDTRPSWNRLALSKSKAGLRWVLIMLQHWAHS